MSKIFDFDNTGKKSGREKVEARLAEAEGRVKESEGYKKELDELIEQCSNEVEVLKFALKKWGDDEEKMEKLAEVIKFKHR